MLEGRPSRPQCNSIHVAPIEYGMPVDLPTEQFGASWGNKCSYIVGASPKWGCLACEYKFGVLTAEGWRGDFSGVITVSGEVGS